MKNGLTLFSKNSILVFVKEKLHIKKGDRNMIKTFEEFIKQIYFISLEEYFNLNEYQKEAIRMDYRGRGYKGGVF